MLSESPHPLHIQQRPAPVRAKGFRCYIREKMRPVDLKSEAT